jgi:hypothetical protein
MIIKKKIEYLFYILWRVSSINYGKDAGIYAAWIQVSILFSINVISLIGLIRKLCFSLDKASLLFLITVFIIMMVINYFYFVYDARYFRITTNSEFIKSKRISRFTFVLIYTFLSILLLVMAISI